MPFIMPNGKALNERDAQTLGNMFEDVLAGYKSGLADALEMGGSEKRRNTVQSVIGVFDAYIAQVKAHLLEAVNSENQELFTSYYPNTLQDLMDHVMEAAGDDTMVVSLIQSFFADDLSACYGDDVAAKDTVAGLETSMSGFALTSKPLPGIESIGSYNPNSDTTEALMPILKGNSTTLRDDSSPEAQTDNLSFHSGVNLTRVHASTLMGKQEPIGASDIFDMFRDINSFVRLKDKKGGHLRGEGISAGEISGPDCLILPAQVHSFCSKIADSMNQIKQTKDPNLQKSQAVQLASFAYQVAISEHIFSDGNGRSCRLLADTILQSFGLPPHTPHASMLGTGATIGNKLDFQRGAKMMLEGVRMSDEMLAVSKEVKANNREMPGKEYLAQEHVDQRTLDEMSNEDALKMAIKLRGNKFGFAEALSDLKSADHLFARNSKQYKTLLEKADECSKCLLKEAPHSIKMQNMMREMREAITEYQAHCKRHPQKDKTRQARLAAVEVLDQMLSSIGESAGLLSDVERPRVENEIKARQDVVIESMNKGTLTKEQLADFVFTARLNDLMGRFNGEEGISSTMAEQALNNREIANNVQKDPLVAQAVEKVINNQELSQIKTAAQLNLVARKYIELKTREEKELAAAAKLQKQQPKKGKKEPKAEVKKTTTKAKTGPQ